MKKFLYMVPIILIFYSCEKELKIEIQVNPKLCFNCILNPDSVIRGSLSLSQSISEGSTLEKISSANIELKEDGQVVGVMPNTGVGVYSLNIKPNSGSSYEINIKTEGFPTLKATTIVPRRPVVKYFKGPLKPKEEIKSRYSSFPFYPYTFEINDQTGLNRYWVYSMEKYTSDNYKWDFRSMYYGPDFIQYDDFNKVTDASFLNGFYFLFYLRILDSGIESNLFQVHEECPVDLYFKYFFMDADEHYDKYLKSTIKQKMNDGENLLFNEPVQIYSNIENGLGIFGSCAIKSFKL